MAYRRANLDEDGSCRRRYTGRYAGEMKLQREGSIVLREADGGGRIEITSTLSTDDLATAISDMFGGEPLITGAVELPGRYHVTVEKLPD